MAYIFLNNKKIFVPDDCSESFLRKASGVPKGRTIARKTRKGTYIVKPGENIDMENGAKYVDMPPRIKA